MLIEELVKLLSLEEVNDEEELEIIRYGLQHLFYNIVGIGTIILFGGAFGMLVEAFIMTLSVFPLRKYAGGFHANSPRSCYMFSCAIVLLGFVIAKKSFLYISALIVLSICSVLIIFFFAPIDCKNRRLDNLEKIEYEIRTKQILCMESRFCRILCIFKLISLELLFLNLHFGICIGAKMCLWEGRNERKKS